MVEPIRETSPNEPAKVSLVREPWGVFQTLRAARRNILSVVPEIATRQPMVSGRMGKRWHMVMDPASNRRILLENLDNYPKSDVTKNLLRGAIGDSMFIAEGAHWRWQRRAAAPVFSHRNVTNLAPIMTAAAEQSAERIAALDGQAADMAAEMVQATFDVISDVTFSGNAEIDRAGVHRAIDAYIAEAARVSLFDVIGLPTWIPRPGRIMSGRILREMKAVADHSIAERRADGPRAVPDLLDLLLAGIDPETKREMNNDELRDNLLTFIVAGHETTALTLGWALYLCGFDQDVQERARAEAQSVLQGRAATAEDVAALPYIRMIIDETLRMYPAAGMISRTAQAPDELCGREIKSGDTVIIPIYALHRNHLLWDDPDSFRPERFADRKAIDRYAYLPFGDGPRICIGASFALQEAVIILATLLSRFRFEPVAGKSPDPVMILTLRADGGVWMRAERV